METRPTSLAGFFEADHDEVDALLESVPFEDPAAALPLLREFDRRLERHIVWEEELLFPAAAQAAPMLGAGPIPVMLDEHSEIRAAKAAALAALERGDGAAARRAIERMTAVLAPHNRKEEMILYPACDDAVPDAAARAVLERVLREAGK